MLLGEMDVYKQRAGIHQIFNIIRADIALFPGSRVGREPGNEASSDTEYWDVDLPHLVLARSFSNHFN